MGLHVFCRLTCRVTPDKLRTPNHVFTVDTER
jgi:hypothetical protein